jgi:hypothetical protein
VDDGRNTARDKVKADADYLLTLETFKAAGFTITYKNSDRPGQSDTKKEYLGFCIDSKTMTIHVPEAKLVRVKGILKTFLAKPVGKVREVASVIGKLIALEPALGRSILVGTRLATIAIVIATDSVDLTRAMQRSVNVFTIRETLRQRKKSKSRRNDLIDLMIDSLTGEATVANEKVIEDHSCCHSSKWVTIEGGLPPPPSFKKEGPPTLSSEALLSKTSRCPYCAFGFHCKFRGMRSLKLCHSCQIMSFISNHAIHVKSCN